MIDLDDIQRSAEAAQRTNRLMGYGSRPILTAEVILELIAEAQALREDLQATKLLAHANAEMFKAEKVDGERYRWLREQNSNYMSSWSVDHGYNWVGEDLDGVIDVARKEEE